MIPKEFKCLLAKCCQGLLLILMGTRREGVCKKNTLCTLVKMLKIMDIVAKTNTFKSVQLDLPSP